MDAEIVDLPWPPVTAGDQELGAHSACAIERILDGVAPRMPPPSTRLELRRGRPAAPPRDVERSDRAEFRDEGSRDAVTGFRQARPGGA
ncbi:hypothetical protein NLU14_21620, partial [Marinobacter sp. 71-i]